MSPMCFRRMNKNLCCIKQLSQRQVSQSGIEWFNVTLFQSPKREHSPGDSVKSASEKPRWTIVAFQTDKSGNQEHKPSIFDHCNLTNMFVMLNSRRYSEIDYDGNNFTQQKFSRVYSDAAAFQTKFYRLEELVSSPNIQPQNFRESQFSFSMSQNRVKNSKTLWLTFR